MTVFDSLQIVFLGIGTGFGSALGTELAKFLVSQFKERRGEKELRIQQLNPIVLAICAVLWIASFVAWGLASLSYVEKVLYNGLNVVMTVILVTFEIWRLERNE